MTRQDRETIYKKINGALGTGVNRIAVASEVVKIDLTKGECLLILALIRESIATEGVVK